MLSADIFLSQQTRLALSTDRGVGNFHAAWNRLGKKLDGMTLGEPYRMEGPFSAITSGAIGQIEYLEGEIGKIRGELVDAISENDVNRIRELDQKLSGLRHLQVITLDFASGISGAMDNFDTADQHRYPVSSHQLKAIIENPDEDLALKRFFYFQNGILGISLSDERKGQLQSLYRKNWQERHSSEWVGFLQSKLEESFDGTNRFYVAFINSNQKAIELGSDNSKVLGYLRVGPYDGTNEAGKTPLYAKYLGAVNIDAEFQGIGFSRFMIGKALDDVLICEGAEVYLHVIPGSKAHTFWQSFGFFDIRVEDCFYGENKDKNQPSQLMKITYNAWNDKKHELFKR